jgi:hypothetical protein
MGRATWSLTTGGTWWAQYTVRPGGGAEEEGAELLRPFPASTSRPQLWPGGRLKLVRWVDTPD